MTGAARAGPNSPSLQCRRCRIAQDLRYYLAAGEPAEAIADFLCRNIDEVRAKTAGIAGRR